MASLHCVVLRGLFLASSLTAIGFGAGASEIEYFELTGIIEISDSVRVSLSHKKSGHLGWLKAGQGWMNVEVVQIGIDPPFVTVSENGRLRDISLNEVKVLPINMLKAVEDREKTAAEISFDATMVMSFERAQQLRKERFLKRRRALVGKPEEG